MSPFINANVALYYQTGSKRKATMSADIKSYDLEVFRKKLAGFAAAENVSDADFADAVYTAVSRFGLPETEFRETFALSQDAVSRWIQQKNLPQPFVRPKILGWIMQKI